MFKFKYLAVSFLFSAFITSAQVNKIDNNRASNKLIYSFLSDDFNRKTSLKNVFPEQSIYQYSDSARFWGDTARSLPNGFGIKFRPNKFLYIGKFKDGKMDGFGFQLEEDQFYLGTFLEDEFSGRGDLYLFNDTLSFNSNFELLINGKINELIDSFKLYKQYTGVFSDIGKGKQNILVGKEVRFGKNISSTFNIKMSIFSGKFVGGQLTDPGTLELITTTPNGSLLFVGNIAAGKNGKSQLFSIDRTNNQSTLYEGDFTSIFNFTGKMISSDGTITEGDFTDLEINGIGKRYNDSYFYEGNFQKNQTNGKGKIIYKSASTFGEGSYFDGVWINGKADYGETYLSATDEYIKGKYVNGSLDGKVTITKNGKVSTATYINGTRQ